MLLFAYNFSANLISRGQSIMSVILDCASETAQYLAPGFFIMNYSRYLSSHFDGYQKEHLGYAVDNEEISYWFETAVDSSVYLIYCITKEMTIRLSGDDFLSYVGAALIGGSVYSVISRPVEELSKVAVFYGVASSFFYTISFKYLPVFIASVPATIAIELGMAALFLEGGYEEGVSGAVAFATVGIVHQFWIDPLKEVGNHLIEEWQACVGECANGERDEL